jgi:beta-lactamase superfamily II metal-dependent hydrolase
MSDVFRVHVLPAQRGDALWIDYGPEAAPFHILIDGGITRTGRTHLRKMLAAYATPLAFELLVVTHVDLDHILGVIELLQDLPPGVTFKDIWFNGWDQLKGSGLEPMGIKEGIQLSELLEQKHLATWNKCADGRAISLDPHDNAVHYPLAGNMTVTVLAPRLSQLAKLRDKWHDVIEQFGADQDAEENGEDPTSLATEIPGLEALGRIDVAALAEMAFDEDHTVPNGSSIALALEFGGKRALMLADAYPSVVAESIKRLSPGARYAADLVKLAHHGSRANTDRGLVQSLAAPTWVFSSNGANNTKHPHREAVARVLHDGNEVKTLVFNYKTQFNDLWDDAELKEEHGYDTVYGDGDAPVLVQLL